MAYDSGSSFVEFFSGELESRQSLLDSLSSDRGCLPREYLPVTHAGQNLVLIYPHLLRNLSQLVSSSDAHLVADHLRPNIQSTPEDSRKSKRIVDLIRKIRSTRCNNLCTGLLCLPWPDLRNRISTRENNRVIRHRRDQFFRNHSRTRR